MLIHPLAERLRGLGMAAMADAFLEMQTNSAAAELSREDWLGLLIDREATARDNKRLGRRLSQARLRQPAVVEDTDFRTPRGLDRALFHKHELDHVPRVRGGTRLYAWRSSTPGELARVDRQRGTRRPFATDQSHEHDPDPAKRPKPLSPDKREKCCR